MTEQIKIEEFWCPTIKMLKKYRKILVFFFTIMLGLQFYSFFIFVPQVSATSEPSTYALDFDGNDDYVYVPFDEGLFPTEYTLMAWHYPETLPTSGAYIITGAIENHQNELSIFHQAFPSKNLIQFIGTGDVIVFLGTQEISANQWNFEAVTIAKNHTKLHHNGVLDTDTYYEAEGGGSAEPIILGNGKSNFSQPAPPPYYNEYDGKIDEVLMFNRALNSTEISYAYNNGVGRYAPLNSTGLIAWWKFDEGAGTWLRDRSGNEHHGELKNGVAWTTGVSPDWYTIDQFYIQPNYNGTLSSPSYTSNKLTFTITGKQYSLATIKIHVGSRGNASDVIGATSWSYNAPLLTITRNLTLTSMEINVFWQPSNVFTTEVVVGGIVAVGTATLLTRWWRRKTKTRTVKV